MIILISSSCNSQETSDKENETKEQPSDSLKDTSGMSRLRSLPAPMQVAASLKKTNSKFQESFLSPVNKDHSSSFLKAVNLGIYAVDLGYANVYEQKQTAINYFSTSLKLADELKMISITEPSIIKRFADNINNTDSVTHITLSSFSKVRKNLLTSNRSDEAYTILAGSFIEGVWLCCKTYEKGKDEKVGQLIAHQKLFLENLMALLSDYKDNKDILDLTNRLSELEKVYNTLNVSYGAFNEVNTKAMLPVAISDQTITEITTIVDSIRKNLIN